MYNGSVYDPLGWNYRNCTSYAFWRLANQRGIALPWSDFPTVYNSGGRIGLSIPDFQRLGYTVDHNPDGASLAVDGVAQYGPGYSGYYGHIMYVEASNVSSAYVSQYNLAGDGRYSTMTVTPNGYTWFVHIP
jgi:surface antigen